MHLFIDYINSQIGLFSDQDLIVRSLDRDKTRLSEDLKGLLEENKLSLDQVESVSIATKGAKFSDVRAAVIVSKLLQKYTSLPLFVHEGEEVSHESLKALIKTKPRELVQAEYSAPPSISTKQ
jgi:hypothetical protein